MRGTITKRISASVGVVALVVSTLVVVQVQGEEKVRAATRYRVRKQWVAPGVKLFRIRDRRGPNRIRVLKVDPEASVTIDTVLANDTIPGHETTSSMARRKGAVAAINGDYTIVPSLEGAGRPVHLFAEDGELVTSPLLFGRNFAIARDEQSSFIGHARFAASMTAEETGQLWRIHGWNESPAVAGENHLFTVEGGRDFRPPPNACSVRLYPVGNFRWNEGQVGLQQDHLVDTVKCSGSRLKRAGGVVVATPQGTKQARKIENLIPGDKLAIAWSAKWPGVLDVIGGNPTLMENGAVVEEPCGTSFFCDRNPRTGIGVMANGKLLLVTVDGRQESSVGMTPLQFAKLFRRLRAVSALNLDGGGSTTMWVKGTIVNRVSGTSERPVGSALLVLPGSDTEEREPAPYVPPPPSPTPSPSASPTTPARTLTSLVGVERPPPVCAAAMDPASTGGLVDALASGAFGPRVRLPHALRRTLDVFRGERSCAGLLKGGPGS